MAILVLVSADGLNKEVYEQLRKEVNWEGNHPPGCKFHAAGMGSQGMRIFDVWSSEEDFNNFINTRIKPALQKRNIPMPKTEIIQVHNINVFPGIERYSVTQTH